MHPDSTRPTTPQVWFITGTSTGLGRAVAERALATGHHVVATARNPEALAGLANQHPPQHLLVLRQDVGQEADNQAAFAQALARFGRVDILLNNAGYGLEGATEELTMPQIRAQMETNFFGLVRCTQLATAIMREQGSGYIINVASIAGLRGYNGLGIYNASKFAVVGFSEALAQELKVFGIRVSIVEPGPYRTDWAGRSLHRSAPMERRDPDSPYHKLNLALLRSVDGQSGQQPGDPYQIADVLLSAAQAPKVPLHMLFGDEAIAVWQSKLEKYDDPDFMDHFPHSRRAL